MTRPLMPLIALLCTFTFPLPADQSTALLDAIPADAVAVVVVDARPESSWMQRVWKAGNQHTLEVLQAWLKAGAHQLLVELSEKLDVENDLTSWLEGRVAVALLRPDLEEEPTAFLVAGTTSAKSAERSLTRMAKAAKRRKLAKYFYKEGDHGKLHHLILKEGPNDTPLHVCFTLWRDTVVMTGPMEDLEQWVAGAAKAAFAGTDAGKELNALPDPLMAFYLQLESLSPRDLDRLPLGASEALSRVSRASRVLEAEGLPMPPDAGEDDAALEEGWPPAEEGNDGEEEGFALGGPPKLPPFFEAMLGSIAYREDGLQYDCVLYLSKETPPELSQALARLESVGAPPEALLTSAPVEALAAVQLSSPGILPMAFGIDLKTAEGWQALFQRGGNEDLTELDAPPAPEATLAPPPEPALDLLDGDLLAVLPALHAGPAVRTGTPDFNPLEFVPATLMLRLRDGAPVEPAFSALRAWLTENTPLRFARPAGHEAWQIFAGDREEPLAFVAAGGSALVVSASSAKARGALARLESGGPSLVDQPEFQEVRRAIGADAPVQFYLNPVEFVAQGGEIGLAAFNRENPYLRHALEVTLEGLHGMGVSFHASQRALHSKAFVGLDYERLSDLSNVQVLAWLAALAAPALIGTTHSATLEPEAEDEAPDATDEMLRRLEELEAALPEEGAEPEVLAADDEAADCRQQLTQLAEAMAAYVAAHGHYPTAGKWTEELRPFLVRGGLEAFPRCPADDADRLCSYGFNAELSGLRPDQVTSPEQTLLVFDCRGASRNPWGRNDWVLDRRHAGGAFVAFCDGLVDWLAPDEDDGHRWKPAAETPRSRSER